MAYGLFATATVCGITLVGLYLHKLNRAMLSIPQDALDLSPHRWTEEEIRETYERACREPIDWTKHLPPKLERRYIVVGGSGLVGGDVVQHLIMRGHSPAAVRIVDFSTPRAELLQGPASKVDFVRADISDPASTEAAFTKPWPSSVSKLPLTVFHTAAVIRPHERSLLHWTRTSAVNYDGTRHSLAAARKAGADIFVFTSSNSVAVRHVGYWIPPWAKHPRRWFQVIAEDDFDKPLLPHGDYFANYVYSKALSEKLVAEANVPGFRTGIVRPGNGIYGSTNDVICGGWLKKHKASSWGPQVIQNFVSAWNVSLAHFDFEAALVRDEAPRCAGRPFVVTDGGPPPQWHDAFRACKLLSVTPFEVEVVPPLPMYLLAHVVEAWGLLVTRFPVLTRAFGWREIGPPLASLQPGIFTPTGFMFCNDSRARKPVEEGGIGYRPGCTTLEGLCDLIRAWNESQKGRVDDGKASNGVLGGELAAKAVAA